MSSEGMYVFLVCQMQQVAGLKNILFVDKGDLSLFVKSSYIVTSFKAFYVAKKLEITQQRNKNMKNCKVTTAS